MNAYIQLRFLPAILVLVFVLSSTVQAQSGDKEKKAQAVANPFELDQNLKTPILIYDVSGGMLIAPIKDRTPKFQLFADGRVIAGGNPGTTVVNGKLTPEELNKTLEFIVNQKKILEIVQKDVEAKIKAGKAKITLADGGYTKFSIDIKKGKNAVSIYALYNAVKNFPEIEELSRLKQIEDHLNLVAAKIHLGDDGEEILKVVNEAVKKKKGYTIKPFTLDELALATRLPEDKFQVRFTRKPKVEGPLPANAAPMQDLHVIYYRKSKIDKPAVTFYGLPKKK